VIVQEKNEAGEESQPTDPADSRADCWSAAEVSAARLTDFRNSLHGTRHERTQTKPLGFGHFVAADPLADASDSTRPKPSTAKNDEDNNRTRRPSTFGAL